MSRIVLFGATGYTGRLTAQRLVEAGRRPILAGRSPDRLGTLANALGGLETHIADATLPGRLSQVLEAGDVLITTVGPFERFGRAALEACLSRQATYIDSSGEPPFLREVFEGYSRRAQSRCALLPACGFDYTPGTLVGALALRAAGPAARRIEIFYVLEGAARGGWASPGTLSSAMGTAFRPWYRFANGHLVPSRPAERRRDFSINQKRKTAVSIAGSEHLTLPRLATGLRDVDVFFTVGPFALPLQVGSLCANLVSFVPGAAEVMEWTAGALAGSATGPTDAERDRSGFLVAARAFGANGKLLANIQAAGPNGYDFTANLLAWAAGRAADHGVRETGALSLVEAFGLEELQVGCNTCGLTVLRNNPVDGQGT